MRTRLIGLLCACALVGALAACGDSDDPAPASTRTATATDAAGKESKTPSANSSKSSTTNPTSKSTGDAKYADFCAEATPLWNAEAMEYVDPEEDLPGAIAAFDSFAKKFKAVTPPAEIADAWNEFGDAVASMVDGFRDATDYQDYSRRVDELSVRYEPSEESMDALEDFFADHCAP